MAAAAGIHRYRRAAPVRDALVRLVCASSFAVAFFSYPRGEIRGADHQERTKRKNSSFFFSVRLDERRRGVLVYGASGSNRSRRPTAQTRPNFFVGAQSRARRRRCKAPPGEKETPEGMVVCPFFFESDQMARQRESADTPPPRLICVCDSCRALGFFCRAAPRGAPLFRRPICVFVRLIEKKKRDNRLAQIQSLCVFLAPS